MIDSGERLRWDRLRAPAVDKHSTGGVGDKISLRAGAAGRRLRADGADDRGARARPHGRHARQAGGDPRVPHGADADARSGGCWRAPGSCSPGRPRAWCPPIAPLYALRDATATVESIPLIASSILSKKVAEGARALVMDVKVGSGAFLPERAQARELARTLIALGKRLGLPVRALLTDMDQPLGDAIGNAAEVREAIDVLRGGGPADVRALTVRLGAEMLVLGRVARDRRDGARRIEAAIAQRRRPRALPPRRPPAGRRSARDRRSAPPAARAPRTLDPRRPRRRRHARRRRPARPRRDAAGRRAACARRTASRRARRSCSTPRSARAVVARRPAGHRRIRRRRARARRAPADRARVHASAPALARPRALVLETLRD